MASSKERLDRLLVARGLAPTREKARSLVLAGRVRCGTTRLDKPGAAVPADLDIEVEPGARYVGRGGHKLAGALAGLSVSVSGRDALDVGASTGGFTQVLLEAGARRVVALDVGRGQLDWGLRNDPRVILLEGVNARYLERDRLPYVPSLATVDVSFISLRQVLPAVVRCCDEGGDVLALAKPQFEVGRRRVGRGGVVRDPALHREVLLDLARFASRSYWAVAGVCASPLAGAEGNREFFLHLRPGAPPVAEADVLARIDAAVAETAE